MGYYMTNAGTPSITDGCKDDISSVTDNSAGNSTINFYEPFQRVSFPFVTPVGASGAIGNVVIAAAGSARVLTSDSAGTATDMDAHVMVFGHDSSETNSLAPNFSYVRAGRLKPRLVGIRVSAAGVVSSGGYRVTCSLTSSTFTLTFNEPFQTAPIIIATVSGATSGVCRVTSTAANTAVINTYSAAGAASARAFHAWILGWDSREYGRSHRVELLNPQRRARIMAGEITYTAGVPAASLGLSGSTVSDDGTGLFTLTFPTASHSVYLRAPTVIVCGDGTSMSNVVSSSTTTAQIQVYDNAGSAVDPGKVYVACLGYDVADEF